MKTKMSDKEFKEEIYELAFGDNAINRGFSEEEVIAMIKGFAHDSWVAEEQHDTEEDNEDRLERDMTEDEWLDMEEDDRLLRAAKAVAEELGYQLRKKEQPTHRELVSSLNGIIGFRKDNLE